MAPQRNSLTRVSSSDSSALSNIEAVATAMDIDSASEQLAASTPPTSVSDARSTHSNKPGDETSVSQQPSPARRSKRPRPKVNYNVLDQFNAIQAESSTSTRNASGLSGRTLVNRSDMDDGEEAPFSEQVDEALNNEWELPADSPKSKSPGKLPRRPSMKDRVKKMASNAKSVLGKRTRDAVDAGKRKLGRVEESQSPQQKKILKELDMGTGNIWDELDLDADLPPPPIKRAKTSKAPLQEIAQPAVAGPMQKTSSGNKVKKWQQHGLYAGQTLDFDPNKPTAKKLQKKRPVSASGAPVTDENAAPQRKSLLGFNLPMYGYLDEDKTRSFRIPYDVYAPSGKNCEKPKDWHKLNKNRLVGDAKDLWARTEKMAPSMCVCAQPRPGDGELGCGEDCLNRVMQYECDDTNCALPAELCSNRPFAEITTRTKKGGAYDLGVEVVKTEQRGHGVRAARSFRPQQVIMEYTGEIITEEECQRRMREVYKDKSCYYLMELERNLVIDGTKGSMARFINHSCQPNCEVRMMKVNGTPRMAVFAGDSGIMTGEELTYDYNFDNFGETRQQCFCGAPNCRGYLGKRLNADQRKKLQKEEAEKQRAAAEEAAKAAKKAQVQRAEKGSRGPGWQGWVAVDDPAVKAELRRAKLEKEEAEKNSSRAQRLAARARRESLPAPGVAQPSKVEKKKASPKRRRTVANAAELVRPATAPAQEIEDESDEDVKIAFAKAVSSRPNSSRRPVHRRTTSTGSKFTEDLDMEDRPASKSSVHGGIVKKTTVSVNSTSMDVQRETITEGVATGDIAEEDHPTVGRNSFVDEISNAGGTSLSKVSSSAAMVDDHKEEAPPAKKQKVEHSGSIRSRVAAAVRSTGKSLRQSTLSFAKLG